MLTCAAAVVAVAGTLVDPEQTRADLDSTFGPTGMVARRSGPVRLALQSRRTQY